MTCSRMTLLSTSLLSAMLALPAHAQDRTGWASNQDDPSAMVAVRIDGDMALIDDVKLGPWSAIYSRGLADLTPQRLAEGYQAKGGNWPVRLWSGKNVPYAFAPGYDKAGQQRVKEAIEIYARQTGIRFTPRAKQGDYLLFTNSTGECRSARGRIGGAQTIEMNPRCMASLTDTLHHLGHSLGLTHADQRPPFGKPWQASRSVQDKQYDIHSVMHYAPLTPDQKQNTAPTPQLLSEQDVRELAVHYPGAAQRARETSRPEPLQRGQLSSQDGSCLSLALIGQAGAPRNRPGYAPLPGVVFRLEPVLAACEKSKVRWYLDAYNRLTTDWAMGKCLTNTLSAGSKPTMELCSASPAQVWQFEGNTLRNKLKIKGADLRLATRRDGTLTMDVAKHSPDAQGSSAQPLWRWTPQADK